MPGLFEPMSADVVAGALRDAKTQGREEFNTLSDLAIDYLNNQQRDDIENELQTRYKETQSGAAGQRIEPITLPITARYVEEAASLYSNPVKRTVLLEDGSIHEEYTEAVNDHAELIGYDEKLHAAEEITVLLDSCGLWFQAKRGRVHPVVTYPHFIYPVASKDVFYMDPAEPEDYLGFIVELFAHGEDLRRTQNRSYAFIARDSTWFYEGGDPYSIEQDTLDMRDNPITWPQPDEEGNEAERALNMLTFWYNKIPIGELIPKSDPDIVLANREINVQWSLLFDTMRVQGWSIPVMELLDPARAQARQAHGSRFPVVLGPGETYTMIGANTPYGQIVQVLKDYIKTLAVAKRQSANDFAIEGSAPASGFAKLVDSLPKLEARQSRAKRLKHIEENVAWPRFAGIMAQLKIGGVGEDIKKMKLRVEYEDIEFPLSTDEEIARKQFELENNLTTGIELLQKKADISVEEAEERYLQNIETNKGKIGEEAKQEQEGQQPPQQQPPVGGSVSAQLFSDLVRQSSPLQAAAQQQQQEEETEEKEE